MNNYEEKEEEDDKDYTDLTRNSSSTPKDNKKKISTSSYYKFSTILAIIITIPGIIVLFVLRHYNIDIIYQIIFSSLAFFICIGFSFKISSKLTKYYKN